MPEFVDVGTQDFMSRSTILQKHGSRRVFFDATNPDHQESLRTFIATGNWGSVHFYPEYPFTDVPMTVLMKFAGHHLGAERISHDAKVLKAAEEARKAAKKAARKAAAEAKAMADAQQDPQVKPA